MISNYSATLCFRFLYKRLYLTEQLEELEEELEIQRELTLDRCQELETLRIKYQNTVDNLSDLENKVSIQENSV